MRGVANTPWSIQLGGRSNIPHFLSCFRICHPLSINIVDLPPTSGEGTGGRCWLLGSAANSAGLDWQHVATVGMLGKRVGRYVASLDVVCSPWMLSQAWLPSGCRKDH
jgi:hypothetical protein